MKKLTIFSVDAVDHLVQPDEFNDVTTESPALTILTDFRSHRPHVVESHISAVEALELMQLEKISVKMVVDLDNEFIGLISSEDLSEQNILLTQVANSESREEVLVADLMHSRHLVNAIHYDDFQRSSVADIIYTLQRHGQQYCIIVDHNHHHIRGLVSSDEISRRLHQPVYVQRKSNFLDIFSMANH